MDIAEFSVRRPVATWMRILIFVLLGGIAFFRLPIELLPNVSPPTLYVVTVWPGVSPEDLETQITKPVEDAVATVQGLRNVSSKTSEGMSTVTVEFQPGYDLGQGALDVLQVVQKAQSQFPKGDPTLQTPSVQKMDPASIPVLVLGVSGVDDPVKIRQILVNEVKPVLESAEGVGAAEIAGGQERAIMVEFDPQVLLARSLTSQNLVDALTRENQNVPGGIANDGDKQLLVRSYGWFRNLLDLAMVPVGVSNHKLILLAEVASVHDSHKDVDNYQRLNGKAAASISVKKQSSANTITVVANAQAKLEQVKLMHPELQFREVYNQSDFVARAVHSLEEAAVLGGFLAMAVVFFFLRNFRSTLVVGTSIPVSIISTFTFLHMFGYTLNTMSLVGLALAAGLIVDDAVVVLENIYRCMEEDGLEPVEAAIQGTRSIVSAVISSTITIMVVFFPILLVPGQTGQMFKQFALVIIVAMAFSLLDALTGVPMLCSQFIRHQPHEEAKPGFWKRVFARWTGWFNSMDAAYGELLKGAMRRRWTILLGGFGLTLSSLVLLPLIGFEFMPLSDTGTLRVQLIMPTGTSLDETNSAMEEIEKILARRSDVGAYLTIVGADGEGGGRDGGIAWISLKNDPQRPSCNQINAELMLEFLNIPGAQAYPFTLDLVNIMVGGSLGEDVELDIFGPDLNQLSVLSQTFLERIRTIPGCADMRTRGGKPAPELLWEVNRDKASKLGLSFYEVATALQTAGAGKTASYFQEGGIRSPIVVQLARGKRRTVAAMNQIVVNSNVASSDEHAGIGTNANASKGIVLSQVAKPVIRDGYASINRQTRQRYSALVGSGQGRAVSAIQKDVGAALAQQKLPAGYFWDWSTRMKYQASEMRGLGFAVVLAIVLIYMLLCIQFENIVIPLSIMLSVPLCLLGVILALFLSGTAFSVMAGIGCLMLVGIAVKNGILLVEQTVQERRRGLNREDALLKACPTRLRPILITAMAAILGMVPIAARGRGGEMEAPMAIAVIGGLFVSTLLTLFVVPMAYLLFDDLEARFRGKKAEEKVEGGGNEDGSSHEHE